MSLLTTTGRRAAAVPFLPMVTAQPEPSSSITAPDRALVAYSYLVDSDPYTSLYEEVWATLNSYSPFTDIVKPLNRISYAASWTDPYKDALSTKDLPEVEIYPMNGPRPAGGSSTSVRVEMTLGVRVTTGDTRVSKILYPLKKVLLAFCASAQNREILQTAHVVSADIADSADNDNAETDRGFEGWTTVYTLNFIMWVPKVLVLM